MLLGRGFRHIGASLSVIGARVSSFWGEGLLIHRAVRRAVGFLIAQFSAESEVSHGLLARITTEIERLHAEGLLTPDVVKGASE